MPSLASSNKSRLRHLTYLAGFFLALSTAIAAYINSSFLEQFVNERSVGLVYLATAAVSLILSFNTSRLTKWLGNRRVIIVLALVDLLALGGIVLGGASNLSIIYLSAYLTFTFLLSINLDLYLESLSDDRTTGRIRGFFLTTVNLAWLLSPYLASRLVSRFDYRLIYAIAGAAMLAFLYIAVRFLVATPASHTEHFDLWSGFKKIYRAKTANDLNLNRIIRLDFLLNFFYAIMVIYLPIYLLNHVGFNWEQIGLIFTVMLIPFVVIDFILGEIADRLAGEKEILNAGLIIAALATLLIPWVASRAILVWMTLLFLTRVGAASLEMMKETYLFKKIDVGDANILFLSRNTYPLAYLVAAGLASLWLVFFPLRYLFLALGLIMLLGLPVGLRLKDTK